MAVDLYCGDCRDVLPTLGHIDAVVSDPPWGIDADTNYKRFTGGCTVKNDFGRGIAGDSVPFDPEPWLVFPKVALWGANCFSSRLPIGRWLVWVKRRDSKLGIMLSDAELCWVNHKKTARRPPGIYVFRHIWDGFDRESERGKTLHPTQKPVALMRWCIERLKLEPGSIILDPYMGSGTTGVAAVQLGFNFVGIESDPIHFDIAARRIEAEGVLLAPPLAPLPAYDYWDAI
jgi:site-specific DNA-methyltransferase (adenine-specific)